MSPCLADGCAHSAEHLAPAPLCRHHLALAHDWVDDAYGSTDALPSPCVACGSRLGVHYPSGWLCAVCEWRLGDSPDGGLAPPRVDVVYYIRFEDRIKIGTTANPRQRLGTLWHDELLAFERGDRRTEHRRHVQFAALRHARTEWFAIDDELTDHIRTLAAGHDDPWALYARWVSEALALRG